MLRSPVYLGKVFFRDALHDAPHEHLVDEKLSNPVQALLSDYAEVFVKPRLRGLTSVGVAA